jgi:hypothetical protein
MLGWDSRQSIIGFYNLNGVAIQEITSGSGPFSQANYMDYTVDNNNLTWDLCSTLIAAKHTDCNSKLWVLIPEVRRRAFFSD